MTNNDRAQLDRYSLSILRRDGSAATVTVGDLSPAEYVAFRRAVWRMVFDRTDRLDVARLLEEIRDRLADDDEEAA